MGLDLVYKYTQSENVWEYLVFPWPKDNSWNFPTSSSLTKVFRKPCMRLITNLYFFWCGKTVGTAHSKVLHTVADTGFGHKKRDRASIFLVVAVWEH
ncbi:hypothetical protein EBT25_15850 [bacterium]|nr:hypothetical protein [bacterium]